MVETMLPLPPELWAMVPPLAQGPLLEQFATLRMENAALLTQTVALQERVRDLEARLAQDSSNSSRPPSSDPPQAPAKVKRPVPPPERKRGGQPGHRGSFRALLPVEQVDQVVVVTPEVCRHCGQPFPSTEPRRPSRAWRHQV